MTQLKFNDTELVKIGTIHAVLGAGDDILKAQDKLKNAMQVLVNYAGEDPGVMFEKHTQIIEQIEKSIKELDVLLESDETMLTEADLILFDN